MDYKTTQDNIQKIFEQIEQWLNLDKITKDFV